MEDVEFEKILIETINKIPLDNRLQLAALHELLLEKKQLDMINTEESLQIDIKFDKLQPLLSDKV